MSKEDKIVFCTGGGCTAKLGAGVLSHILEKLPRGEKDPDLLVGYDSRDDAAVYRITDDIALVQTVDFFPPIADDPYLFGQIAATNALSDVYAMGGEPKLCLNIMAIPADMLEEVGIGPCSTVQMHVSRGRIIIQAVDEEACGGSRYCPCDCCCEGCRE